MKTANTTKPSTAMVYLRVASSDQRDQQAGIERQRRVCEDYARGRGLTIAGVYADAGISGLKARRPALDRMLRELSDGCVEVLLVADQTRLAREPRLHLAVEREIARHGVGMIACNEEEPEEGGRRADHDHHSD